MIDFVRLQQIMKERLEADRSITSTEAVGATLDEAVANAASMLGVTVKRLQYEIVERGAAGFMGSGRKDWRIRAYELVQAGENLAMPSLSSEAFEIATPIIEDRDGAAFVHLGQEGAFLKVAPPVGKGRRATERQAMDALRARAVHDIDEGMVSQVVKSSEGEYIRVGSFTMNPAADGMVTVDIGDQEMKAYIYVTPPNAGGCDLSAETIFSFLRNNRVVHGVDEEFVRNFADKPQYKEMVCVADGTRPVNGRDAFIQYNFVVDQTTVKLKEGSNGRVDFKELNIIQNVVDGQPLARKVPAERGSPGKTVTGKILPAKNGKDIPIPLGKNVHVSDDQLTIVADMNGQVVIVGGKVNVEPVYTVQGDVSLRTGNIIFLGTVIITGNVEDGFSVKAAGNIEVHGTVGKAELDAEGDIIVHQGIAGKSAGFVRAGKSIWARFIENARVEAGALVVVSDGIINSQVDANKRIICQGKRAHIVGGQLRAAEEINAKILGSPVSGTETVCEVGFDPKSKEKLDLFESRKVAAEKQLEEVELNLQTLINIKKQRKSLPEDKEAFLRELVDRRRQIGTDIARLSKEISDIQSYLATLKTRGRVSASAKVYPGVRIVIRDVKEDVKAEYRAVTFVLENNLIRVTKYEETDEDIKRGPDGYSTD
ncbi:MAG: polymerase [Treponema sp. GWB1_62_6]|nr:MAG: polymerase [Treponema sp. GWC1_61_84]OHE65165.1 MAG: polymerase [Treponema sp. GWA1_62_8]OHE72051.1 MAG: polymerase [Treponema sp. GWB1_62_6]OHE74646.1 MAG: polymerase [Treponema sp. RIFOXYC1_FULL_61_9]HCM27966.1 polymerase [Treponema sp.]